MGSQNINGLQMARIQSFGSKSYASEGMRDYVKAVVKQEKQLVGVLTDIRDIKTPAEIETGKVFKTLA